MTGARPESTTAALVFGRWAVSFRVWSLVSVLLLIPITLRNAQDPGGRAVVAVIVGCLSFGLVLLVARMTWLRLERPWLPRPVLVLAAWGLACAFRLLAINATVTNERPLLTSPNPATVLVPGVLAILAAMALFSYVFGLRDSLKATSRDLAAATADLTERRSRRSDTLRRQQDLLASSIASVVLPAVDALVRQITYLEKSTSKERLQACAETAGENARGLVREVSHRVTQAAQSNGTAIDDASVDTQSPRPRRRPQRSSTTKWAGVLLLVVCLPALGIWIPRLGGSSLVIVLVALLPWLLSTPVAERHLRPSAGGFASGYVVWVAVVSGVVTAAVIVALHSSWPIRDIAQVGPFLAYFWVLGLVTALLSRDLTALDSGVRDLQQTERAISATIAEQDAQITLLHRKVGEVLHGPVQGTLSAVTLALRLAANSDSDSDSGDLTTDEVLTRCLDLLLEATNEITRLGSPDLGVPTPVNDRLQLLSDRWTGLMTLTFVVDDDAADLLADDEGTAQTVMSVVEEAIHNAARHGGATTVDVNVGLRPGEQVIIEVTDNGTGPPASPRVGLGLAVIEPAGGTWQLDRLAGTCTRLVVHLPVDR